MEKPVILCVDDERFVLQSLKTQLRTQFGKDYAIEATESVKEALELIHALLAAGTELPILISDHIMPEMKGDDFLIYVHSLSKSTLKIMLTGQADAAAVGKVVNEASLYRYISKPWDKEDLNMTVKEALHKYHTNKELEEKNKQLIRYNEELEQKIAQRTAELQKKNEDLTDSINYAQRIQHAMLPFPERIAKSLAEFFILFKPKDIVSGDFYWFQDMSVESYNFGGKNDTVENKNKENKIVIVCADCTGHGVPGAFMSMIGNELLNQIVNVHHVTSPDLILNELHKGIRYALQQGETANRDGMDISIVTLTKNSNLSGLRPTVELLTGFDKLEYAGAMNPFYYVQNGQFYEIKADKMSIGGLQSEEERIFTKHTIQLQTPTSKPQTVFYLCSDGFQDQFGGSEDRKFMVKKFRELLFSVSHLPMNEQRQILHETINEWMAEGKEKQVDDILVMGVRI
jgi:phosphoserine phosphatase RsbU/P